MIISMLVDVAAAQVQCLEIWLSLRQDEDEASASDSNGSTAGASDVQHAEVV